VLVVGIGSILLGALRLSGVVAGWPILSVGASDVEDMLASDAASLEGVPTPNILVVTLCSMRADRIGAYGYAAANTPVLDALAEQGVRFTHAWSTATYTLPSHASLLTGLLPSRAGVVDAQDTLPLSRVTLPEVLRLYGYTTLAWSPVASRASFHAGDGLEQGFDRFYEVGSDHRGEGLDAVLEGVREPWFVLAHFKGAHRPYGLTPGTADPRIAAWIRDTRIQGGPRDPDLDLVEAMDADPALRAALDEAYDLAVTGVDQNVGHAIEAVADAGALDRTIVVVVGDHGEELGENDHVGHQAHLDPEIAHVPLLVRIPGVPGGRVVTDDVSMVDLLPTLAALAGAEPPAGIDGRSIRPLLTGEPLAPRRAIVQSEAGPGRQGMAPDAAIVGGGSWFRAGLRGELLLREDASGAWSEAEDPAAVVALRDELVGRIGALAPQVQRALTAEEKAIMQREGYW
jgi:arylsulfatase A-like enzyme